MGRDGSVFAGLHAGSEIGTVRWPLLGRHNVMNALSALAACRAVGVDVAAVIPALARFRSVKRRIELLGDARGVPGYADLAHHPNESGRAACRTNERHAGECLAGGIYLKKHEQ